MRNALLGKARAILAHPKQESLPKAKRTGDGDNTVAMTEPTAPAKNAEIQPSAPNTKTIYWQTGDGRILGPATSEFLARDGDTFWIVTTFDGQIRWINADQLRSKKAFEEQLELREVEPIRF